MKCPIVFIIILVSFSSLASSDVTPAGIPVEEVEQGFNAEVNNTCPTTAGILRAATTPAQEWKKKLAQASRESLAVKEKIRQAYLPLTKTIFEDAQRVSEHEIEAAVIKIKKGNLISTIHYGELKSSFQHFENYKNRHVTESLELLQERMASIDKDHMLRTFDKQYDSFSGDFKKYKAIFPIGKRRVPLELDEGAPEWMNKMKLEKKEWYTQVPVKNRTEIRLDQASFLFYPSVTPVGEYGEKFAESLLMTNAVLRERAMDLIAPQNAALLKKHFKYLALDTARGEDAGKKVFMQAMSEGILSTNAAFSELLAQKIEGISDYKLALAKILEPRTAAGSSAFEEYVQRSTGGAVVPLTLHGKYFPKPILLEGGVAKLNPQLTAAFTQIRQRYGKGLETYLAEHASRRKGMTGMGCPLGFSKGSGEPKSGVQYIGEAYAKLFGQVDSYLNKIDH